MDPRRGVEIPPQGHGVGSAGGDGQELLAYGGAVERFDTLHRMTSVDLIDTVSQAT